MDLALKSTTKYVENRTWLRSPLSARTHSATLDVSTLTKSAHYPNDYMPSGMALGKITATGLYSNYDAAAVDGTQTCVGLLFSSVVVGSADVGIAVMHAGDIISTALPTQGAVTDGDWDAAAAVDLPSIVDLA